MQKFISGIIIGFLLGTLITVTYAAMSGSRQAREYNKFSKTSSGLTSVLITIAE